MCDRVFTQEVDLAAGFSLAGPSRTSQMTESAAIVARIAEGCRSGDESGVVSSEILDILVVTFACGVGVCKCLVRGRICTINRGT